MQLFSSETLIGLTGVGHLLPSIDELKHQLALNLALCEQRKPGTV